MQYADAKPLEGHLVVVETEGGDAWIGVAQVSREGITIRTGNSGRPKIVPLDEVDEIGLAIEHADVVLT